MTKQRKSARRGPRGWGTIFKPKYCSKTAYHETKHYWIRYKDENEKTVTVNTECTTKDGAAKSCKSAFVRLKMATMPNWRRRDRIGQKTDG